MPDFSMPDRLNCRFYAYASLFTGKRAEHQAMTRNFSGYWWFAQSIRKDI